MWLLLVDGNLNQLISCNSTTPELQHSKECMCCLLNIAITKIRRCTLSTSIYKKLQFEAYKVTLTMSDISIVASDLD